MKGNHQGCHADYAGFVYSISTGKSLSRIIISMSGQSEFEDAVMVTDGTDCVKFTCHGPEHIKFSGNAKYTDFDLTKTSEYFEGSCHTANGHEAYVQLWPITGERKLSDVLYKKVV